MGDGLLRVFGLKERLGLEKPVLFVLFSFFLNNIYIGYSTMYTILLLKIIGYLTEYP